MEAICVIPARGGSKRIPRKNIRMFHGKPMILYAIELAQNSGVFSRVIVSTDDSEIASVAESGGAEVPFIRPGEISHDSATTVGVIKHTIDFLGIYDEMPVCCLYPSTPLLKASHLIEGYTLLNLNKSMTYVAAVQKFEYPVQRRLIRSDTMTYSMEIPENLIKPTQSFDSYWHDAGQFYWGLSKNWQSEKPLLVDTGGVKVEPWESWDIDTEEDWKMAEILYGAMVEN